MVASLSLLVNQARPWPIRNLRLWLALLLRPLPCFVLFGGPGWCSRLRAALPPLLRTAIEKITLQAHYKGRQGKNQPSALPSQQAPSRQTRQGSRCC
jgi:hypothetical protein